MRRRCQVRDHDHKTKQLNYRCDAWFHQWSMEHEEYDSGPGHYTVAIIEFDDGTVEVIWANRIKFIDGEVGDGSVH